MQPLVLKQNPKDVGNEDQVLWSEAISISGPCAHCHYLLHKSCASASATLPLSYICDACKRRRRDNLVYHCSFCNYDLDDVPCANNSLSLFINPMLPMKSEEEVIDHSLMEQSPQYAHLSLTLCDECVELEPIITYPLFASSTMMFVVVSFKTQFCIKLTSTRLLQKSQALLGYAKVVLYAPSVSLYAIIVTY